MSVETCLIPFRMCSAIHQLLLNACQATRTGYISLVCEDISRKDSVPEGYEASLPTSIISIRITDTGHGMPRITRFFNRMRSAIKAL
jgi:signal transduction histidine kinase